MFAIDTNILVYAHNRDSGFHRPAIGFIEKVMNNRDEKGNVDICIPVQVLMEFVNVMTRQSLPRALKLEEAIDIISQYNLSGARIVDHRPSQLKTFIDLLMSVRSRKKVFDIALAATLKDNGIEGLYTANVADFAPFKFLRVVNPLLSR